MKPLSSKVKTALVLAISADLASLALGVSGGLPWVGVIAALLTSLIPVVGAYWQTETVYPPQPEGTVPVPVGAMRVPKGAIVTMPANPEVPL